MGIPSVLAEAGFATGAGGAGALAVVGCGVSGVSGFLFPHISLGLLGQRHLKLKPVQDRGANHFIALHVYGTKKYGRGVPISNTGWEPA
jgi:hypothetical protein